MYRFLIYRMLRLVFLVAIAIIIYNLLTFGWQFSFKRSDHMPGKDKILLAEDLERHVYKLAYEIGDRSVFEYNKLEEAAAYIAEQFESFGYEVKFQVYRSQGREVKNIFAVKKSSIDSDEHIVVGAHYDTCFNPGADDNASGLAGLLELARFIAHKDMSKNIKFVAFVNEEPPFFKTDEMGSRVFARSLKQRDKQIKAAIILEMIGVYSDKPFSQRYPLFFGISRPNKANFIGVVSNFKSRWLSEEITSLFKKESSFPIESVVTFEFVPGVDFSDHWPFWMEGYPAVMITDTGFYRYPHYHTQNDTYEKLNYTKMAEVVYALGRALVGLSDSEL